MLLFLPTSLSESLSESLELSMFTQLRTNNVQKLNHKNSNIHACSCLHRVFIYKNGRQLLLPETAETDRKVAKIHKSEKSRKYPKVSEVVAR